jgi:hypothetical protein
MPKGRPKRKPCIYIARPFLYKRHVSSRRLLAAMAFCWLVAIIVAVFRPMTSQEVAECDFAPHPDFNLYIMTPVFGLSLVVVGVMKGLITRIALRHFAALTATCRAESPASPLRRKSGASG